MSDPRFRRTLKTVSVVLLSGALALAVWQIAQRWQTVKASFAQVRWDPEPVGLVVSVLLLFAGLVLNPGSWILISRELGVKTPFPRLAAAWFGSQLGRYVPGKIWLSVARIGFLRSEGLSLSRAAAATVWEALTCFASVGLVALPMVLLAGGELPKGFRAAIVTASAALLFLPLLGPVQRLAFKLKKVQGFTGVRLSTSLKGVLVYSTAWTLRGLSVWLWLESLGLKTRSIWAAVASAPLSWLAGYVVVFVPGGIGIREAATAAMCDGGSGLEPVMAAVLGQTLLMIVFDVVMAVATMKQALPKEGARGQAAVGMSRIVHAARLLRSTAFALAARRGLCRAPMPINLTLSVTRRCQSRCSTCLIWKAEELPELDLETIERTFQSIGWTYFFNISGGEPFLRKDLPEIVRLACRHLHPAVIHIPTNALMPERIQEMTTAILEAIALESPGTVLTVKPSLDGVGARHDELRGVAGNFEKLIDTVGRLRRLRESHPSLHVGVGTVISRLNASELPGVMELAASLDVDTYINEIAEEREEFFNLGTGIAPDPAVYRASMGAFKKATLEKMKGMRRLGRITSGLRLVYYDLVVRILEEERQVIPCYAGLLNVHINADGAVWPCATMAYAAEMGKLGATGGFREIWRSPRAWQVRRSIRRGECWCPLANQAYSNILMHPPSLLAALFGKGRRG